MNFTRLQFQQWGAVGGRIRARRLSKARRKEIAKAAAAARLNRGPGRPPLPEWKKKPAYVKTGKPRGRVAGAYPYRGKVDLPVAVQMYKTGSTLQEIGKRYDVSREMIRQLMKKEKVSPDSSGRTIRMFLKAPQKIQAGKDRTEQRERNCLKRFGLTLEQYNLISEQYGHSGLKSSPFRKYTYQRHNARTRGIGWKLIFAEWWKIWQDSGKWSKRGRGKGYAMCRFGDTGPYAIGNVEIITGAQNSSDQWISGKKRKPNTNGFTKAKAVA